MLVQRSALLADAAATGSAWCRAHSDLVDVWLAELLEKATLRETTGLDFTAKDFRTWAGTVLAARALACAAGFRSAADAKRRIGAAVDSVAKQLGNTRAVCRKCYIHPAILDAFMEGVTIGVNGHHRGGSPVSRLHRTARRVLSRLSAEECAVVRLIEQRIKRAA